jgi:glycosyltransferase involved in cell wall biosynthesis
LGTPFFSVIIPVFRDYERLLLCLSAIQMMQSQEFEFEVIIVNNDPVNETLNINPTSYSFPISVIHEIKPGSYAARNKGVSLAKGKILAFTDSDCLPDKDWLNNAWSYFLNDYKKEIGVLTGPVPLFFKNPEALSNAEVYEKFTGFTTAAYAKEGHAITANWISRAEVIREFGGFNGTLKSNGDSELSGKISKKYQIAYREDIVVRHPARYETMDLVNKYKRLLGGTYSRRFKGNEKGFRSFFLDFVWKRYRFALKKIFTVTPKESWAILKVCHAINIGVIQEYFNLIKGGETKR